MHSNNQFSEIMGVSGIAKKLVQLKKYHVYPLVYLLVKLTLLLFVATATVKKVFSTMIIKLNCAIDWEMIWWMIIWWHILKKTFEATNENIIQRFQNMKSQRELL